MSDGNIGASINAYNTSLDISFGEVYEVDKGLPVGVIANPYSSTQTYAPGDYVIYKSKLYRCIVAIEEPEEFDSKKWTQVKLANEVQDLAENLDEKANASDVASALALKADGSDLQALSTTVNDKADKSDVYTKEQTYSQTEVDNLVEDSNLVIANKFDENETYYWGSFVIYEGELYALWEDEFSGPFDPEVWSKYTVTQYVAKEFDETNGIIRRIDNNKIDKTNPAGTGSFSLNRREGSTVGTNSVAMGTNTVASGNNSLSMGYGSAANGKYSVAMGNGAAATGTSSNASGHSTTASGSTSHAEGYETTASGSYSHAEGQKSVSSGNYGSHAEGYKTTASGESSHSEGDRTESIGNNSHAEGILSSASGDYAHAEGYDTTASGVQSHAEGRETIASAYSCHAEGLHTQATQDYSHSEGCSAIASGHTSHAEGYSTTASGNTSHAEGEYTTASGPYSHAEGSYTTVSGHSSHAEGSYTTASGDSSHAEGLSTTASGNYSHSEGLDTIANHKSQHVFGEYNVEDNSENEQSERGNYVEIVGNGYWDSEEEEVVQSNARTLDWNGNEVLAGDLTYNGNKSITSEIQRLDNKIDNLPAPMIFKGTLGVGGTIQSLPTASASNEGWTYKCITAGTYAGLTLKVGDTVTCFNPPNTSTYYWDKTGSQDTDTDTWRAIKVNGVEKLGNGISSGAVDFVGSENIEVDFDGNGNKVGIKTKNIYTDSEVDELLDDKADADNTYTKEQVDDIVYGILPDDTASGSVANFTTSLELPIKSLEADVNAVQEAGNPTPTSPLPISGWSEINLYQLGGNFFNKNTVTNGKLINGSGNEVSYADWNISDFIPVVEGASYYLYGLTTHPNTNQDNFELFNASKVKVGYANVKTNEQPYVIPSEVAYIKCSVKNPDLDTAQLGVSVNASFVPYNPVIEKTVINLGGTYYGGHLTQDKAGHRQFVVTHDLTTVSEMDSNRSWYYSTSNAFWINEGLAAAIVRTASGSEVTTTISDYFETVSRNNLKNADDRLCVNTSGYVCIYGSELPTTKNEFLALVGNAKLVYPLATPYVVALPDGEPITTLNGTNNIYADTGDCAVEYKCSVAEYVANHSGGGGVKSLGGVFLGSSNSGNEEEPTEESEEPKEETK